jgi:Cu/Ag efflux protein CusF
MAVKLTKSQAIRDRQTGKVTIQHDYIKSHSTPDLIERYNSSNLKPKVKQKVKNELVRRGGVVFK